MKTTLFISYKKIFIKLNTNLLVSIFLYNFMGAALLDKFSNGENKLCITGGNTPSLSRSSVTSVMTGPLC